MMALHCMIMATSSVHSGIGHHRCPLLTFQKTAGGYANLVNTGPPTAKLPQFQMIQDVQVQGPEQISQDNGISSSGPGQPNRMPGMPAHQQGGVQQPPLQQSSHGSVRSPGVPQEGPGVIVKPQRHATDTLPECGSTSGPLSGMIFEKPPPMSGLSIQQQHLQQHPSSHQHLHPY